MIMPSMKRRIVKHFSAIDNRFKLLKTNRVWFKCFKKEIIFYVTAAVCSHCNNRHHNHVLLCNKQKGHAKVKTRCSKTAAKVTDNVVVYSPIHKTLFLIW